MAASSNIPETQFYSSPMKLFVVALLSSLKNFDNSTSKLVFRPLMHQPRIYAGAPAGVHVTTVHAYDPDKPRKKVEYNLPNVLDYKHFVVDKLSGNLSTAMTINKTVGETYQVMVAAVSYGSSELEHLQIAVTEFNQFSPRFEQRIYYLEFHPKTEVDTIVLKVRATDPDPAPHNAEIYYKLDQNTTSQYFTLNSMTGELSLNQAINESDPFHNFGIFAEDGGSPKRWDYVPVYVIMKSLSAPQNVTVFNITHDTAVVCWEAPLYDYVSGYVVNYYPSDSEAHFVVNMTVTHEISVCESLEGLIDDTDYHLQVFGWNHAEQGQKSDLIYFHTSEDWCKRMLCKSGTCVSLYNEPWYECDCPQGFYGASCEHFDPCTQNPCGDNGKCLNTTHNEYVCICAEDYSGPNCGSYNPCLRRSNPCENGGTCEMTTNNTYICLCASGFYGRKCKHRDLCASNPCLNGGTCNTTSDKVVLCSCPNGFTGDFCETDTDECISSPCQFGSTCLNQKGNFTCVCPLGYVGQKCENSVQCPADKTDTEKGMFYWNATNHSTDVVVLCPFGSIDSTDQAFAYRSCVLHNNLAFWGTVNTSKCKGKGFVVADELVDELHTITKDPTTLNTETLEAAAQGIETISTFAAQDKQLAAGMVKVISNLMDVNDTIVKEDENSTFTTFSKSLRKIVDDFASNVELKPGEALDVSAENVRIQSLEWHPDIENETSFQHLEFEASNEKDASLEEDGAETLDDVITTTYASTQVTESGTDKTISTRPPERPKIPLVKVFVPKEALQEAHRQLDGNVRVKFIVYYNDKLFQSKQPNKPEEPVKPIPRSSEENTSVEQKTVKKVVEEPEFKAPVLQISVGNVSLKNMNKPLIYVLPIVTKKEVLCVYWDEDAREWSSNGLTTNHTKNYVICQSSHMTAFSVLLDLTPRSPKDKVHESILSVISYVGSILSIIGLSLTIITYLLFGCLNRDHPGRILANLCISLLLMNTTFLIEAFQPAIGGNLCAVVGLMLHYFVLTSLSWMCVEAINMYQLLVHVFASSETHFMLKRCFFAWGGPLIIVAATAGFKLDAYYEGLNDCMLSPHNPWIYYCSFLAPSCIILAVNFTVFILVSRVIFTPRLTAKTSNDPHPIVTAAQVRGAFTVMVLLGVTWVFGTLAFGHMKIIFQYAFCIANSMQGFLIFLVRCLLYPEARNAWIYLFKTGKLKKHRGVIPPGTVSFSNSQGCKNAASTSQSASRNESSEDSGCVALDGSLFGRKEKNGNIEKSQDENTKRMQSIPESFPIDKDNKGNKWKGQNSASMRNDKNFQPYSQRNEIGRPRRGTFNHFEKNPEQIENYINKSNGIQRMTCPNFHKDTSFAPHIRVDEECLQRPSKGFYHEPSRFSLVNTKKRKCRLPFSDKKDASPSEFRKDRRSASIDVVSGLNGSGRNDLLPSNGTIDGLKSFFTNMKLRSSEQASKDKRSLSLNVTTPEPPSRIATKKENGVHGKKEKRERRMGFKRRSSIVLEREEDQTDDEYSTSTDVEDSPPNSTAAPPHSRRTQCNEIGGQQNRDLRQQCNSETNEDASSLRYTLGDNRK